MDLSTQGILHPNSATAIMSSLALNQQSMVRCQYLTARNTICSNSACTIVNNMHVCGIHENFITMNGPCAYCLDPMDDASERLRLYPCRHYLHRRCFQRFGSTRCGICRTSITAKQAADVLGSVVFTPIVTKVYEKVADSDIRNVISSFKRTIDVAALGDWQGELLPGMIEAFGVACDAAVSDKCIDTFPDPRAAVAEITYMVNKLSKYLHTHGTFDGFSVEGYGDTLYIGGKDDTAQQLQYDDAAADARDIDVTGPAHVDDDQLTVVVPPAHMVPQLIAQAPAQHHAHLQQLFGGGGNVAASVNMPIPVPVPVPVQYDPRIQYRRVTNVVLGGNGQMVTA